MKNRILPNRKKTLAICLIASTVLLVGCKQAASTTDPASLATLSSLQTENARLKTQIVEAASTETLPPTSTPSPTTATPLTPTPTATVYIEITIPEGSVTLTHNTAADYVFVIDPTVWTLDRSSGDPNEFLLHKTVTDCRIDIAPADAPPAPEGYYTKFIGKRNWLVREYDENAYYEQADLTLDLNGYTDETCSSDQETILENLLTSGEYSGGPPATPVPTATKHLPLGDFVCQGALPVRLRVGDNAIITADFLWLRKEPRVSEATEIRLFPQYAPVAIDVVEGPQCEEPNVYWQVQISDLAEGGEVYSGWMAESDGSDYYLDVWYLGW